MSVQSIPPVSQPTTAGQLAARATQNDQILSAWLDDHEGRVAALESDSGTSVSGTVATAADLPAPEQGKSFIVQDEVALYVAHDGVWQGPFPVEGTATDAAVADKVATDGTATRTALDARYAGKGANTYSSRQQVFRADTALPSNPSTHRAFDATLETRNTTDTATPTTIVAEGVRSRIQHGSASVDAKGSNLAVAAIVDVIGSGAVGNEHAAYFGVVRMGSATKPANGRVWVADLGAHGPLGSTRPELLTGVTCFMNNYYNGTPSDGPSVAFAAVTKPGAGPAASGAGHNQAGTYPMDIGFAVVGQSRANSTDDVGFKRGIQIGGYASGWMDHSSPSRVGTGMYVTDYTEFGIHVGPASAVQPTAPGARFERNVELTNQVQLRGVKADGTTKTMLASVNSGDDAVYGQVETTSRLNGSSMVFATAGGTMLTLGSSSLTVADGKHISVGTTNGSMIGATPTQKLGFFGTTPRTKPTGVTADAASIHAALVSLGLIGA